MVATKSYSQWKKDAITIWPLYFDANIDQEKHMSSCNNKINLQFLDTTKKVLHQLYILLGAEHLSW